VGKTGMAVYLDFADAIKRDGEATIREKYGNLFHMYQKITGENPYKTPMRIYPAIHYTMGGLWVDYYLQSTVPGLFVLGEANFSDHGANRLGASALMQGLADGYFIAPYTVGDHLASRKFAPVTTDHLDFRRCQEETRSRINQMLSVNGKRSVDSFHRELGKQMWDFCGMSRSAKGLETVIQKIRSLREEFWTDLRILGTGSDLNQDLEHAGRVADFLEFGELLALDALTRNESCGGHFREEYQTKDNDTLRDDQNFSHVAAWQYAGPEQPPVRHTEALEFHEVHPSQRSYK
jgi:succinate dehydrogenase / fumarate reductase flavoprotein subunit